jgi:hypothetical protein
MRRIAVVVGLLVSGPAGAQETDPAPWEPQEDRYFAGLAIGLGTHYGALGQVPGIGGVLRPSEWFAVQAGVGKHGPAGSLRIYPLGPLYVQGGYSPLLKEPTYYTGTIIYRGPGMGAGVEMTRTRLLIDAGLGVGWINLGAFGSQPQYTFDLAIGMNLGDRAQILGGAGGDD